MTTDSYLRYPHISGDSVVFVAENDVWLASRAGGRAFRVSADHAPARSPRLSPDGSLVAWTADRDGAFEVYVAPADGGISTRLTFWGQAKTLVRGWLSDTEILVVSTTGQAERQRAFAYAVPVDGSPSRRLPYGWLDDIAIGPDGGVLLSTSTTVEPAWWKRYRGGTAAQLWLDLAGDGEFRRVFADLSSSLVSPLWTGQRRRRSKQRIGFVSDQPRTGQPGRPSATGRQASARADVTGVSVRHSDGRVLCAARLVRRALCGLRGRWVALPAGQPRHRRGLRREVGSARRLGGPRIVAGQPDRRDQGSRPDRNDLARPHGTRVSRRDTGHRALADPPRRSGPGRLRTVPAYVDGYPPSWATRTGSPG